MRTETELDILKLQQEADAAVVEAHTLENVESMQVLDETGKSVTEKVKFDRTSEFVQSQRDLQNHSLSPYLPAMDSQ